MREGKFATVAMREAPGNAGNALLSLTKQDIGIIYGLALAHKVTSIKLAHEKPNDELHANELKVVKRICDRLKIAYEQKP